MPTMPPRALATRRQEPEGPGERAPASRTLPRGHLAFRVVAAAVVFAALVSLLVTAFEVGR